MICVILDDFPSVSEGDCAWITLGRITYFTATIVIIDYQRTATAQNSLCFVDYVT
jgi:hypothetical protein